jgi:hypothetical protein
MNVIVKRIMVSDSEAVVPESYLEDCRQQVAACFNTSADKIYFVYEETDREHRLRQS